MVAAIPANKKKLTDVKIGERPSRIRMRISPLETLLVGLKEVITAITTGVSM